MLINFMLIQQFVSFKKKSSSDEKYKINYGSSLESGHMAAHDADPRLFSGWSQKSFHVRFKTESRLNLHLVSGLVGLFFLLYVPAVLRVGGANLLSPPTPKSTHLQLIQGRSTPPLTSFKRLCKPP